MKIRTDFVTNSSSSSFIICFQSNGETQKTVEELLKLHLMNEAGYDEEEASCYARQSTSHIFSESNTKTVDEVKKYLEDILQWDIKYKMYMQNKDRKNLEEYFESDEYKKIKENYIQEQTAKILSSIHPDSKILTVDVSDHSIAGSILEHGILPRLPATIFYRNNH